MSTMSTPFPMDSFDTESDESLVDDSDDQMTWLNEDQDRQRNNGATNGDHIQIYKITQLTRGPLNTARRTANARRERSNVDELRQHEQDVFMRKLWNYLFEVMRDRELPEDSTANDENASDVDEDGVIEDLASHSNFSNDEPQETENPTTNAAAAAAAADDEDENRASHLQERQEPPQRRRHENTDHDYGVLSKRVKRNDIIVGRNEVFGKIVGMRMQDIKNETQKLLAEKMINETLFMAEMGKLSMSHSIGIFNNM